jgi:hypothetical protein
MPDPSTYRGLVPFELYVELHNNFPQMEGESETAWLYRVRNDPALAYKMFGTPQFKNELMQAVARRTMAQAGARRAGHKRAGPGLIKLTKPGDKHAVTTIAQRYRKELMVANETQYKYATQAYDLLIQQFDGATPVNGSLFWNGINELALAKKVDEWNREMGPQMFGQLEATTAARYVNKKFEWEEGPFKEYFTKVSDKLGEAARGHVTAVVRCGLRNDSIFTVTELPRMLGAMEQALKTKKPPTVTDLTIVVIQPKHLPARKVATFTNNEISMIPIVRPGPGKWRINGPDDCVVAGHIEMSLRLREYWSRPPKKNESAAATRIKKECDDLIKWP